VANFFLAPILQIFGTDGNPAAGAKVNTFAAGTTTPLATFTDASGSTPLANPVLADSLGRVQIWLSPVSYKFVVTTSTGVALFTIDNFNYANVNTTLASLTVQGTTVITNPTAATALANQSSPTLTIQGQYWNGTASANDNWVIASTLGTGTNPTSTLTISHSGSSGAAIFNFPSASFGNLTVTGNVTLAAVSSNSDNSRFIAGSDAYPTIAAARTAAVANTVEIPSSYAGSDAVADGTNPVFDLRHNAIGTSHYFIGTFPMTNAPGGLDVALVANGAGDLVLRHNLQVNPATTTAVTLNIGVNTNFLVGNTALFGTGGTAPIIIGRDTANEETVGTGNWSIVDGTHLTVTCAKSHSGTTDIEQLGVTQIDPGITIQLNAHKPAQFAGALFPPTRWNDPNGSPFMATPGQAGATFPFGQILIASNTAISGFTTGAGSSYLTPGDVNFRNADASHNINFSDSSNVLSFQMSDAKTAFVKSLTDQTTGGTAAAAGAVRLINNHNISWRNAANSADLAFVGFTDDFLHFNTAAVNGLIPSNVGVANLVTQAAAVGPTTIRAVAANQAGMYRVSWSAVVTQAASTSSTLGGATTGFQVTYTDNDTGAAVTTPLAAAPAAGTNTAYSQTNSQNVVGAQASGVVIVNAKASTNIQYNFGYTSVGATVMQYALHVRIEPI
jgi:hypothetical protein